MVNRINIFVRYITDHRSTIVCMHQRYKNIFVRVTVSVRHRTRTDDVKSMRGIYHLFELQISLRKTLILILSNPPKTINDMLRIFQGWEFDYRFHRFCDRKITSIFSFSQFIFFFSLNFTSV